MLLWWDLFCRLVILFLSFKIWDLLVLVLMFCFMFVKLFFNDWSFFLSFFKLVVSVDVFCFNFVSLLYNFLWCFFWVVFMLLSFLDNFFSKWVEFLVFIIFFLFFLFSFSFFVVFLNVFGLEILIYYFIKIIDLLYMYIM